MIPAGPALPAWPRDLALAAAFGGLLLASLPGRRGAAASPGFAFLVPLALFAGSAALSTVLSAYPDRSLVRAAYAPIAWLLFLVAQAVAVTPAAYRRLLLVLAGVVAIVGADGLVQLARGRSLLGGSVALAGRLTASLPHPNDLALIPVLLPVALAGLVAVPATRMTRGLLAAQTLAIATAIGSASRNAWLGLALGLGLLGALAWPIVGAMRRRLVAGAGVIALVLFVVGFAFSIGAIPERARRLLDPAQEPRYVLWRVAGTMFREAPVVGMGVHTFEEFHRPLVEALALPPTTVRDAGPVPWAHNLYLEVLAERGLVGALGLAAPLIAMATALRRGRARGQPAEMRTTALGLAASLVTFLGLGLFDLTFLKDWVMLVFWLLAALCARLPVLGAGVPPVSADARAPSTG